VEDPGDGGQEGQKGVWGGLGEPAFIKYLETVPSFAASASRRDSGETRENVLLRGHSFL